MSNARIKESGFKNNDKETGLRLGDAAQKIVKGEPKVEKNKESEILEALHDYDLEPSKELARKLDFYFTPYNKSFQLNRFMSFGAKKCTHTSEQLSSAEIIRQIRNNTWSTFKSEMQKTDIETLKRLKRF